MGSESIAHEAEGLVGQKNIETIQLSLVKAIQPPLFWFSKPALFATSGL